MSRTSSNTDHVKVANNSRGEYEFFCEHCGTRFILVPPIPVDRFLQESRRFLRQHTKCVPC